MNLMCSIRFHWKVSCDTFALNEFFISFVNVLLCAMSHSYLMCMHNILTKKLFHQKNKNNCLKSNQLLWICFHLKYILLIRIKSHSAENFVFFLPNLSTTKKQKEHHHSWVIKFHHHKQRNSNAKKKTK